jgi:hypothetical protein
VVGMLNVTAPFKVLYLC